MENRFKSKESLSPIMHYSIVLVALMVMIISSLAVWTSGQPAAPMDMEARAAVRASVGIWCTGSWESPSTVACRRSRE